MVYFYVQGTNYGRGLKVVMSELVLIVRCRAGHPCGRGQLNDTGIQEGQTVCLTQARGTAGVPSDAIAGRPILRMASNDTIAAIRSCGIVRVKRAPIPPHHDPWDSNSEKPTGTCLTRSNMACPCVGETRV